ncbi:Protein of unknown function [Pyronema omphalodes CBS 100304]|uniref:Uncharacterized protein n=1 Tax=Pyronema omphalodes (strain CBS 100304) TaxID=1076935 RepID=U4LQS8_PYROM|nr:Protein of unknown function [Pyronema omphalodes CBS 100304]
MASELVSPDTVSPRILSTNTRSNRRLRLARDSRELIGPPSLPSIRIQRHAVMTLAMEIDSRTAPHFTSVGLHADIAFGLHRPLRGGCDGVISAHRRCHGIPKPQFSSTDALLTLFRVLFLFLCQRSAWIRNQSDLLPFDALDPINTGRHFLPPA